MATPTAKPEEYGPRPGFLVPSPAAERGVALVVAHSADGKYFCYANGTTVVVRSVEDPNLSFVYTDHVANVKVAKFAPTGKYVASGDVSGKVRVWAFTNVEHTLKFETQALGGEVEDIAWDSESKRILAVGGGSTKAKVFSWDTGSNLGEIIPHSKKVITGDIKSSRPFKLAFGGEDFNMSFYQGPPFKYEKGLKEHTNFVNCVRYSPDGSRFVSVSSDKQGIVYDGGTAAVIGKLDPSQNHSGSIYFCDWSPDGMRLATAGADKTVKVWDMSTGGPTFPNIATFILGKVAEDMQNSVIWPASDTIISLSLDGSLNYLSVVDPTAPPTRKVYGHQAPMNTIDFDPATGRFYTGDLSGRVCVWDPMDPGRTVYQARPCAGDVPAKKAAGIAYSGGELAVVSWDDKLRIGDAATGEFKPAIPLPGQPKGVAASGANPTLRVVITGSAVLVFKDAKEAARLDAAYGPTCVDVSQKGNLVVVGGKDKKLHMFKVSGTTLEASGETKEFGAEISVVGISPDGTKVAAGDGLREVRLYDTVTKEAIIASRWMNHTTRVTGLKWSPDGRHIATVSTDRRLCIWDPSSDSCKKSYDLANPQPFAGCVWTDANTLWTLGTDGVAVRRVLVL